jgi:hypothetical protein
VTRDPQSGAESPPALLDDNELSPEVALVDPDVAERARDALPDITLTEIRISLSIKVQQAPPATVPHSVPEPVAVAEPTPALALAPAPTRVPPADRPPPPAYDEIRQAFREPRFTPRRRRRSIMAALVILAVVAGVALALPRALDGPASRTSAKQRPAPAGSASAPGAHRAKTKKTGKGKPRVHKKGAARRSHAPRPAHKAKPKAKKHTAAPPAATKPVSKPVRKHRRKVVHPAAPAIPDFVWAPAQNVSGYLVEFRAGSKVVLRARTRSARLHVSRKRLPRGRYRWLVWALTSAGSPASTPLVDSKVTIR